MSASLWLDNLIAWSLQIAVLAVAGLSLPAALKLRSPRVVHLFLQVVLAACLLLPVLQPWRTRIASVGAGSPELLGPAAGSTSILPTAPSPEIILLGIAAVAGVRLLWLLLGLLRLRAYRRDARPFAGFPESADGIQSRVGAQARFFHCSKISSPVTFGLWRAVILVPDSFHCMDARAQEAIACHELLHVRRRDWLRTLAEEFARALFWFHPVLLRLIDRIRLSREQMVDALTVHITGSREHYVQALLENAATPMRPGFAAPSLLKRSHLAERLSLLLKETPMSKTRLAVSLAAVATVVAVAAILAVRWLPLETAEAPLPPVPGAQVKPPPPPPATPAIVPASKKREQTYRVRNGITPPVLLEKTEPGYTEAARDKKIQGKVLLSVRINSDGVVDAVKVMSGLEPGLDNNAVAAIRRWKFKPGMKDGNPVAVAATVEVNFRLM